MLRRLNVQGLDAQSEQHASKTIEFVYGKEAEIKEILMWKSSDRLIACDKLTIAWMGNPNYPS